MSIFCNYNIPIFPMTFGAITMGAGGCGVPMGGYSYNPFMSSGLMYNYTQPIFNFNNTSFDNSSSYNSSGWTMPWTNWFNNFSFNFNTPQLSMPSFDISSFKFNFNNTQNYSYSSSSSSTGDTFTRSNSSSNINSANFNNNAVKNLSWWKEQGYNEKKGKELAANAKKHSDALRASGVTGNCGRGVRESVNKTFYGGSEHHKGQNEQAKNFGNTYFAGDSNFKKINVQGMNLSKDDIPAGAIVIYDAGYSNSKLSYCGHIEVSDGNGHGYSDLTTTLLQNNGRRREPKEIWIPV